MISGENTQVKSEMIGEDDNHSDDHDNDNDDEEDDDENEYDAFVSLKGELSYTSTDS